MRKLLITLAIAFISEIGTTPIYAIEADPDEHIVLTGVHDPDPEDTRARSIGPNVTACLHHAMGQLEVAFEYYSGDALIEVLDWTGMPVISYSCNTTMEWNVYLPMPADEGAYTLKIHIANAAYVGHFVLVR